MCLYDVEGCGDWGEMSVKGSEKYRIAIMCAEKEPLDCHRTILICHQLKHLGLGIKHILSDGTLEDHQNAELRLLKLTKCERNLFDQNVGDNELMEEAYKKRAGEIAYKTRSSETHYR